jgi:hypothetical protein
MKDRRLTLMSIALWLAFLASLAALTLGTWGRELRRASDYSRELSGGLDMCDREAIANHRLADEFLPYGLSPVCLILSVGFLPVLRMQARAAARTIEAIERSRPAPDELAAALRAAARKSRGADAVPPERRERSLP